MLDMYNLLLCTGRAIRLGERERDLECERPR